MIPLMIVLACGGDTTTGSTDTGTSATDTGTTGTTDSAPVTSVTDTVSFFGTAPPVPVPLPTFAAINQLGEPRGPDDLVGQATVLWFYPFADSPG
jgi:hypothetical protein